MDEYDYARWDGDPGEDIDAEPEYLPSPVEYEDEPIDGVGFARPGSALRAATRNNPRNLPCPTCGRENVLTPIDVRKGYQCDHCADAAEGFGGYGS